MDDALPITPEAWIHDVTASEVTVYLKKAYIEVRAVVANQIVR
jgi:hypothetical protein